ncbi:hypothetical protein [Cellulomonas soli]
MLAELADDGLDAAGLLSAALRAGTRDPQVVRDVALGLLVTCGGERPALAGDDTGLVPDGASSTRGTTWLQVVAHG